MLQTTLKFPGGFCFKKIVFVLPSHQNTRLTSKCLQEEITLFITLKSRLNVILGYFRSSILHKYYFEQDFQKYMQTTLHRNGKEETCFSWMGFKFQNYGFFLLWMKTCVKGKTLHKQSCCMKLCSEHVIKIVPL